MSYQWDEWNQMHDELVEMRTRVIRVTAELAVEKAEHAETTRELNRRYTELADDGARLAAAEAREKKLRAIPTEVRQTPVLMGVDHHVGMQYAVDEINKLMGEVT